MVVKRKSDFGKKAHKKQTDRSLNSAGIGGPDKSKIVILNSEAEAHKNAEHNRFYISTAPETDSITPSLRISDSCLGKSAADSKTGSKNQNRTITIFLENDKLGDSRDHQVSVCSGNEAHNSFLIPKKAILKSKNEKCNKSYAVNVKDDLPKPSGETTKTESSPVITYGRNPLKSSLFTLRRDISKKLALNKGSSLVPLTLKKDVTFPKSTETSKTVISQDIHLENMEKENTLMSVTTNNNPSIVLEGCLETDQYYYFSDENETKTSPVTVLLDKSMDKCETQNLTNVTDDTTSINAVKFKEYLSSDIQTRILLTNDPFNDAIRKNIMTSSAKFLFQECGSNPSQEQKTALINVLVEVFQGYTHALVEHWLSQKLCYSYKTLKPVKFKSTHSNQQTTLSKKHVPLEARPIIGGKRLPLLLPKKSISDEPDTKRLPAPEEQQQRPVSPKLLTRKSRPVSAERQPISAEQRKPQQPRKSISVSVEPKPINPPQPPRILNLKRKIVPVEPTNDSLLMTQIEFLCSCDRFDDIDKIETCLDETLEYRLNDLYNNSDFSVLRTFEFFSKSLHLVSFSISKKIFFSNL